MGEEEAIGSTSKSQKEQKQLKIGISVDIVCPWKLGRVIAQRLNKKARTVETFKEKNR